MRAQGKEITITVPESVAVQILWTNKRGQVVKAETYGPMTPPKASKP